ncbi:hypothetical protein [uncultured Clostridium sp.]|uniref:hypothetical protein n=1 Tax=uncultured Clostridium sp. TaxID=59620 RepID=UPI0026074340|nr:hypothetical protein [uncultured Clostridium sp.]
MIIILENENEKFTFDVDFEENEIITIQKLADEFMKYNDEDCDLLDSCLVSELAKYKNFGITVENDDKDEEIEFTIFFEVIELFEEEVIDDHFRDRDSLVRFKKIEFDFK